MIDMGNLNSEDIESVGRKKEKEKGQIFSALSTKSYQIIKSERREWDTK